MVKYEKEYELCIDSEISNLLMEEMRELSHGIIRKTKFL
jgi:hypothetical protein